MVSSLSTIILTKYYLQTLSIHEHFCQYLGLKNKASFSAIFHQKMPEIINRIAVFRNQIFIIKDDNKASVMDPNEFDIFSDKNFVVNIKEKPFLRTQTNPSCIFINLDIKKKAK
ncbi:hypothetical protein BpHYR1_054174 [Brachionus plicatilis]|uniref:Uncharacterized protein n=1 Tax=Brachionus plicatilis TaxID=10195 RepID=A0A3M7S1D9_BRAPC|nr:hypothetical protein BpHYR1_054174 [Brachionus plicatilis]